MKLIIGLGNPGRQYEKTRHNAGFMALDALWKKIKESGEITNWELSKKFNAEISESGAGGKKIILAKPMTYMNDSGYAAQMIMRYFQINTCDLIVVHDDKDIPIGEVKPQEDRGDAGHNGVRSIIESIGSQNFSRVRVGIAPPNPKKMSDISKFVLDKFSLFERKKIQKAIAETVEFLIKFIGR